MAKIKKVKARWVLDSRGNPTVEAEVHSGNGFSRAIVPSGASTGRHEALELRDKARAFGGKGVIKAVSNINNKIAKLVKGQNTLNQAKLDGLMSYFDNTPNKSGLGANAVLAVSMACAREAARTSKQPLYSYIGALAGNKKMWLPMPYSNVINGGEHAGNRLDIQEFMLVPKGAKSFAQATQVLCECYQELKKILRKKYGKAAVNVGDEGGFAPNIRKTEEAIRLILRAAKNAGHERKARLAIDAAASEFYKKKKYSVDGGKMSGNKLMEFYADLVGRYPIVSLEDPFAEDDWQSWVEFTACMGKKLQIVGDDLLVTNPERIGKGIQLGSCNALLLKVNQIGSLTEAIDAHKMAKKAGWNTMVSHRSGETEDSFISDLTVGLGCGQIKLGAPARGERTAKFNRLLRIEEELGKRARLAK